MDDVRTRKFRQWGWDEIIQDREKHDKWVVDGLIAGGSTLITGKSEAGKSMLCAALVFALATGRPFLGRKPNRAYRPAIIGTDDRAHQEYQERLALIGRGAADEVKDNLGIFTTSGQFQHEDWLDIFDAVVYSGFDFVIIDNLSQMIVGETNMQGDVNRAFAGIRLFTQASIPVVIAAHSKQHGRAGQGPMGHSAIVQNVRHRLELVKKGKKENDSRRDLIINGNYSAEETLELEMPQGIARPVYKVLSAPQQRKPETYDKNADIAKWIGLNCQHESNSRKAELAANHFGVSKETIRNGLKPGRPLARLLAC